MKKQAQPSSSKATAKTAEASPNNRNYGNREVFLEYAVTGWNNYLKHQPAFAALSTRFTVKLAQDEITALKKLKQALQDTDISEERIDLLEDFVAINAAFKSVLWYISEAFPNPSKKQKEAGLNDFKFGSKYGIEKVSSIIETVQSFLNKHKKELSAHDNMPPGFIKEFSNTANRYLESFQKLNSSRLSLAETNEALKTELEARWEAFKKMQRAANTVFAGDLDMRKMYQGNSLKNQVRSTRKTELVITIYEAGSNKIIKEGTISIKDHPELTPVVTEYRYKYEIAPGTCSLKIKAPGFHPFNATKEVIKGVKNRLTVFLEPLSTATTVQPQKQPAKPRSQKTSSNGVKA